MSQSLYLEMPKASPKRNIPGRLGSVVAAVAVVAALAGLLFWLAGGRVQSSQAMLDGMVAVVTPQFSGTLLQLDVGEGDMVAAGQVVGRVDSTAYAQQLQTAGREVVSLRPPDMGEMAGRLKAAQEAEKAMVQRLASARNEEQAAERHKQDLVAAHVRAQLQLRALDAQGGAPVVGKDAYARAQKAEVAARNAMEQGRVAFEEISRMRAAMEQELTRIRDEVLRARQLASYNRYTPRTAAEPLALSQPDGTLYAPVSGRILPGKAAVGQVVQTGQPVLCILPEGADKAQAWWVMAYFGPEEGARISKGQDCSVTLQDGTGLSGTVAEVQQVPAAAAAMLEAPAVSLAAGQSGLSDPSGLSGNDVRGMVAGGGAGAEAAQGLWSARIVLDEQPADGAGPGQAVQCVVHTRSIAGFSGF